MVARSSLQSRKMLGIGITVGLVLAAACGVVSGSAQAQAGSPQPSIPRACVPPHDTYPFCDHTKPLDARLDDLIARLTLSEKPYLMVARESPKGNISRLGIPEYDWGLNAIHGVQSECTSAGVCATSFPDPNCLGSTFNQTVWHNLGAVIGVETRSLWLQGVGEAHSSNLPHMGLDVWSPNIGIVRDPRWGRNLETPSEAPLVCGLYGQQYSLGTQNGSDARYLQVVTTLKHFDANSLEGTWGPGHNLTRHTFNAVISAYDLQSTYLPAFRRAVMDGGAASVMCSYNAVNGVPSCANSFLLQSQLRDAWGFYGVVTSDSGAVVDVLNSHHYTTDMDHTVAATVKAGCDVESAPWPKDHPWATGGPYINNIPTAVGKGLLSEADVDTALRHVLGLRFRLGLFDPIEDQPYWHVPPSAVRSSEHVAMAMDATRQGLVLLQNGAGGSPVLPFVLGQSVAVVGPHANERGAQLGNYIGEICADATFNCVQTPYEAIAEANSKHGGHTCNATGVAVNSTDSSGIAAAMACVKSAQYVVYVGGLDGTIEREGMDRHDIGLPGLQPKLLSQIVDAGKPLAAVLYHGGIVTMDPSLVKGIGAIVGAGYPGFYAAQAIADALFDGPAGSGVVAANRWGKTAVTWYSQAGWEAAAFDMLSFDMGAAPGRTFRYYNDPAHAPQWAFGHGLSYTTFAVGAQPAGGAGKVAVTVTNTGKGPHARVGDDVWLAYFTAHAGVIPSSEPAAKLQRELFAFARVGPLAPGAADASTGFEVTPAALTLHQSDGTPKFWPGAYDIEVSDGTASATLVATCTASACTVAAKV